MPQRPNRPIHRLRLVLLVPAALLLCFGVPALAESGGSLPAPTDTHVALGAPAPTDGAAVAEAPASPGPAGPGWTGEAKVDANLVGVTWSGDPGAQFSGEARGRRGQWVSLGTVGIADATPDANSPDARAAAKVGHASEPLWIGQADTVRVRLDAGSFDSVGLDAVRSLDPQAPGGSAGAWSGSIGLGVDRGFGVVLVLMGLVLVGVAIGWSPWRSRRSLAVLAVLAIAGLAACGEPDPPPPPDPTTTAPSTTPSSTTTSTTLLPHAPRPTFTLRSTWGPDLARNPSPDCAPGPVIAEGGVKFAVIHHTVNSNSYTAEQSTGMVRAIWSYHVNTLGYCDIAYNFIVDAYGRVFEGRQGGVAQPVVAAHAAPLNEGTVGAAFLGNFSSDQPTPEAWKSMAGLLAWKLGLYGVNPKVPYDATAGEGGCSTFPPGTVVHLGNRVVGHRDVGCTECPGNTFYGQLPWMQGDVAYRMGF